MPPTLTGKKGNFGFRFGLRNKLMLLTCSLLGILLKGDEKRYILIRYPEAEGHILFQLTNLSFYIPLELKVKPWLVAAF